MMRTNINIFSEMVIIDIGGSFDIAEVTGFENRFKTILREHPANIAIHMSELSYIDSSGIGSLIRCMNYALREGTKLMCYGLNESINSVFEITHLNHFIEVLSEDDFSHKYSTIH